MKLVDTNVLVYAVNGSAPQHHVAKRWLDSALSGGAPVGFAWLALVGFIRLTTHPVVFPQPLQESAAMDYVDDWLSARSAALLQPGSRHPALLRELLEHVGSGGNLTNDAHLAALAREHKATVVTFDSDFTRFPGIRTERPR
ncbi:type II toxin-antitoxin system VapC family toxin [Pseudactinotalea sp.]|uniref:type II toxin-antitoxin system VapC family toxin n=1 Tax=Pseudactinotalea sp. TaxID=1926260 RepID=UPI003B3A9347